MTVSRDQSILATQELVDDACEAYAPVALVPPADVTCDYEQDDGRDARLEPEAARVVDTLRSVGADDKEALFRDPGGHRDAAQAVAVDADDLEERARDGAEGSAREAEEEEAGEGRWQGEHPRRLTASIVTVISSLATSPGDGSALDQRRGLLTVEVCEPEDGEDDLEDEVEGEGEGAAREPNLRRVEAGEKGEQVRRRYEE